MIIFCNICIQKIFQQIVMRQYSMKKINVSLSTYKFVFLFPFKNHQLMSKSTLLIFNYLVSEVVSYLIFLLSIKTFSVFTRLATDAMILYIRCLPRLRLRFENIGQTCALQWFLTCHAMCTLKQCFSTGVLDNFWWASNQVIILK